MQHLTRDEHLFDPGPKRLLALDGGGVRGMLSLGYLERMESFLRARHGGDPDFRLSDYFDLIGGTSIGAVLAAGLALGYAVAEIQALFSRMMISMFRKPPWRIGVWGAKYDTETVIEALKELGGNIALGSDEIKTGLMVIAKRLDTGSPWIIHNNPRGKFYGDAGDAAANCNLLLHQVVRASTAAPLYFDPERIALAPSVEGLFVDGGVSTANNPALQLLLLATTEGFGLRWPLGAENLLLVSVGTGRKPVKIIPGPRTPAVQMAVQSLLSIMNDCDWLNQTILQWLSQSPTAWEIDAEIGDLRSDLLGGQPQLSYLRYNVLLDPDWLQTTLGVETDARNVASLEAADNPANMALLAQLGRKAARVQIREDDWPACFDLP
jgi:hypothetical protein